MKHYLVDGTMVDPDLPDMRRRLDRADYVVAIAPDGSREVLKDQRADRRPEPRK